MCNGIMKFTNRRIYYNSILPRATRLILASRLFKFLRHVAANEYQLLRKNVFCDTHKRHVTNGNIANRCFDLEQKSNEC